MSPEWKKKVGVAHLRQLAGRRGRGEGTTASPRPGHADARRDRLRRADLRAAEPRSAYGAVQNASGKFVKASIESVTAAAAAAAKQMPADYRVSITNAPGDGVYPISSFTWMLLYQDPKDKAQGKAMVDFMKWALTDGQKFAADLGYAPLPEERRRHGDEDACDDQGSSSVANRVGSFRRPRLPARNGSVRRCPDRRWSSAIAWRRCTVDASVASGSSAGNSGRRRSGIPSPASSARGRSSGARSTRPSSRCSSRRRSRSASPSTSPSCAPAWLQQPLVFLTELLAAIPSIVYGLWGIFVLVPFVRQLEAATPDVDARAAALQRSAAGPRHAVGGADPARS